MGATLIVTHGTADDLGKRFDLGHRAESHVGRGPGMNLSLNDPAWAGQLRLTKDGGVYRVTNELGHSIFFGDIKKGFKELPDGETFVWYVGVDLQATSNTTLSLAAAGEEVRASTAAAGPAGAKQDRWQTYGYIGIILLAVPILGYALLFEDGGPRALTPGEIRQQFRKLGEDHATLIERKEDRTLIAALAELNAARFEDVSQHPTEAYARYLAARSLLDRVPPSDNDYVKDVAARAHAAVRDRIDTLGPRVGRAR